MSKLAHSCQETMNKIEEQALEDGPINDEPPEDDPRVLLDEIDADAGYLFGRAAINAADAPAMAAALRLKIRKIKSGIYG